ncbi:chymotrypsin BII-like [Penaeus chinensis]|uniref:chymotrypsin BII-like n=1 Tax=Penaeus chinensis TaxID=139456 RepID=UPI001FB6DF79|nr:chymotrypsin BII-like [Penaeus chinensis]
MVARVALLLAFVAAASGNPAAGKPWHWKSPKPLVDPRIPPPAGTGRIVGGTEAVPNSWPHQVALFIDGMYFCGGSLISNEWVLTAAHCMDGAGFVDVVMGAHNIRQNEATQVSMTSTDFFTHEHWNSHSLTNDLALIKLPSPVQFNDFIGAVKLPSSDVAVGTTVTPTGWGRPSDSAGGISDILRQVDVPIMDTADCSAVYGHLGNGIVCIDAAGGKGTCNGDSGGPLNLNGVTYGITSFGSSAGCEVGYPDAFSRVFFYLDWIETNTGITP